MSRTWTVVESDAIDFLRHEPDEKYDFIYIDPPYFCGRDFGEFSDRWSGVSDYIGMLQPTMVEACRLLKDSGNMCIHVDWHACHHVRLAMESTFGESNFRNEIIWCYSSGGASQRHFSRKHDNLLVFSKNAKLCKFNTMREPYPRDYGERSGFHPEGRIMNDWWQIGIMSTTSSERVGYPTQKPLALLRRLVGAYTDLGDLVLDFFCGSGTTGVAACQMGRRCVLVDKSAGACQVSRKRLESCSNQDGG